MKHLMIIALIAAGHSAYGSDKTPLNPQPSTRNIVQNHVIEKLEPFYTEYKKNLQEYGECKNQLSGGLDNQTFTTLNNQLNSITQKLNQSRNTLIKETNIFSPTPTSYCLSCLLCFDLSPMMKSINVPYETPTEYVTHLSNADLVRLAQKHGVSSAITEELE